MSDGSVNEGILMTGFPGFIAGRLVERLLASGASGPWYFLVEARFAFAARERCLELAARFPDFAGRWFVVTGDIRRPDLGMTPAALERVRADVTRVWHLAAVYDLTVGEGLARAVNVQGTVEVLDLCERLPRLAALLYISTCYVAGDRIGHVWEDELECGQGFANHYESTKFAAEVEVRRRLDRIPTVILRPAIVLGDSRTGEVAKGDGPYFVMQLLFRLPRWLPMVNLGPSDTPVNLVPVDFVIAAMAQIAADKRAIGRTFALADPAPKTASWILDAMLDVMRRAPAIGTLPLSVALPALGRPVVSRAAGVPTQILHYFNHDARFDVRNSAELLAGTDVACPDLGDYLPTLIDWARAHPQVIGVAA